MLLLYMIFTASVVIHIKQNHKEPSREKPLLVNPIPLLDHNTSHLLCSLLRTKVLSNMKSNKLLAYLILILLSNSNDVHLNPGPESKTINQSTSYLCGTCDQPVTWDHKAIICDTCDQWYHVDCQDVHSGTYSILKEDGAIRWDCIVCNNPNYTTICFDTYSFHSENSFSILSLSHTSLPSPDPSNSMKPTHASTPKRSTQTKQNNREQPPLKILNVNCQSLKKKQERLENLIDSTKPDIIIATETWLEPHITNNQVFPPHYTLWRNDRTSGTGGGVLIAIKDTYLSVDEPTLQTDCEIIWAKIQLAGHKTLYICAFYNPRTSDEDSISKFGESLQKTAAVKDAVFLIGGDFNLPGWDWKHKVLKPSTAYANIHYKFADLLDDHGLTQLIDVPTRNQNTLDLLITNLPSKIMRSETIPGISDHDIVYAELDINPVIHKQLPRKIPLYKKVRWDSIGKEMDELYCNIIRLAEAKETVETLWETFNSTLQKSIENHIPHKTTKTKDNSPWITPEIRHMIKRRDRLYKRKKKSNHPEHINQFKKCKHQVQKMQRQAYWSYIEGIIDPQSDGNKGPADSTNQASSKRLFTFIKHRKKDNSSIIGLKDKGILYKEPAQKAKILNKQFHSVFSEKAAVSQEEFRTKPYMDNKHYPTAPDIIITVNGVEKLLNNLNPHKAAGPDQQKPMVLKKLAKHLSPILTTIYNVSLDTSQIPSQWKKALVSPVFKKGNRYQASNYRPISLTCICCKILEHIVTSNIMTHGESNNILYPLQHGFRKRRSCESQLLEFTEDIAANMAEGIQTDVLIMDFSKAFDKVSHSLLVHKLLHYGIKGKTNKWIQEFLRDRTQEVVLDGHTSGPVDVESGVPQGSVLGPSLFLYYINDIPDGLNSTARLFADDTSVYMGISSESDCGKLQEDLDKLAEWEQTWKMEFHPDKCNILTVSRRKEIIDHPYHLRDHILQRVDSAKYLGVTITKDLNWGKHIDNITSKATQNLNFLRRNLNIASTKIKETAYMTIVRPTLEYACTVWDPHENCNINKIEMVQRRSARYVKHRYHNRSSVTEMLQDLNWKSLQQRRYEARLAMLYKINNELVAIDKTKYLLPPSRLTRHLHQHAFQIPQTKTTARLHSFFPQTIRDWNKLPPDIVSAGTVDAFKAQLATICI